MSILITSLVAVAGVVASLLLMVLTLAGSANSSPWLGARLQALMWASLAFAALGFLGAVAGLLFRRPPIAMTFAVVPLLATIVLFGLLTEVSKTDYEKLQPAGTTSIVLRTLVMLVFGGGGLAMFYVGTREYIVLSSALKDARPVQVEIVQSEVFQSTSTPDSDSNFSATRSYRPDVRFRYQVDGTTYESDLLRPTVIVQSFGSHEAAASELAPFPLGSKATGYYTPAHPERAFLVKESSAGPKVFIVVGLILTPVAYLFSRLI